MWRVSEFHLLSQNSTIYSRRGIISPSSSPSISCLLDQLNNMVKAEYGTAKHASTQMRKRGLQKTKFYCQICEKQCLDDNGFKCHIQSESHIKSLSNKLAGSGNNSKQLIEEYSQKFLSDFLRLLRISHGEKLIGYNKFYQEYIGNKDHIHLNSTKWKYLTSFVIYLKESELCRVEANEDLDDQDVEKFSIAWIDKSPESALRKKLAKERALKSDNEISDKLLKEQIERAKLKLGSEEPEQLPFLKVGTGLENHEKIKISFGNKSETVDTTKSKPIMKCGMKIIPTNLATGEDGSFVDDGKSPVKKKLKLRSRLPQRKPGTVTSGNIFKKK